MASMLRRRALLPFCLAIGISRAADTCSKVACQSCSMTECRDPANGCFDNTPSEEAYSRRFCVRCDDLARCREQKMLDENAGCRGSGNFSISILLGFVAGTMVCFLPCCFLSKRAKHRWSQSFLDTSNNSVARTTGTVKEMFRHSVGDDDNLRYSVVVAFSAAASGNRTVSVRAERNVAKDFFESGIQHGSETEVAYRVRDPRDFIIVESERFARQDKMGMLLYILGFLCLVGVGLGVGLTPATGCALGLIPLFSVLLSGCFCGHFLCALLDRRLAQCWFHVNSESEAPGQRMLATNIGADPSACI